MYIDPVRNERTNKDIYIQTQYVMKDSLKLSYILDPANCVYYTGNRCSSQDNYCQGPFMNNGWIMHFRIVLLMT